MKEYVSPGIIEVAIKETASVTCWRPSSPAENGEKGVSGEKTPVKERTRKFPNIFDYLPAYSKI